MSGRRLWLFPFKGKGADTDPSSYRPISLLNTVYKVFAAMLQSRLAKLQ